jgi:hypothetical protein
VYEPSYSYDPPRADHEDPFTEGRVGVQRGPNASNDEGVPTDSFRSAASNLVPEKR